MKSITSIVVGTDFTPGCVAALREAIRIGLWNQASVRAVHVIDTLVATDLEEALSTFQKDVRAGLVADAQKAWERFAASIPGASAVPLEVRVDNRARGILAAANTANADLLVLGAYGSRAPDVGLGTIATACVRNASAHAPPKILLVRDTGRGAFTTVVACVDFSPTSLVALDQAARVALQDGAALHVLHVFQAPWQQLHYRAPTPEADPRFQQQYRDSLERRLVAFAATLGREIEYLKPTFAVIDDQGHRAAIPEYARRVGADLIVLGTRGRTNLRDVLLGSTAEKVLRESTCSVLAVRPDGASSGSVNGE